MSRAQLDEAISIGCCTLGFGATFIASARLHISWPLAVAAIPFLISFVAILVLTIGSESIKPIGLYIVSLSSGCCVAIMVDDQRHIGIYVVGLVTFVFLFVVGVALEHARTRR